MKKINLLLISAIYIILSGNIMAQTFTVYTTSEGLPDDFIQGGIVVDQNNNVWAGTANGVAKFDGNSWQSYTTSDGLVDNYIKCIDVDINNNVWVGTEIGVSKYNGSTWTTYTSTDGLIYDEVKSIACDNDGSVWFGTDYGLSQFEGTTWTTINEAGGLPSNLITCIHIDNTGNKWFGTMEKGVIKYDGSTFTTVSYAEGLVDSAITCITTDNNNNLMAGTFFGISVFNSSLTWTENILASDGIYNNFIRDILVSSAGVVWVAMTSPYITNDGGVSWNNGTSWVSYDIYNGISNYQILQMAIDENSNIWVATGLGVTKISNYTNSGIISDAGQPLCFPNPSNGTLYFNSMPLAVEIYDITGRQVYSGGLKSSLNLTNLTSGYYSIVVTKENGETVREKLCIEK